MLLFILIYWARLDRLIKQYRENISQTLIGQLVVVMVDSLIISAVQPKLNVQWDQSIPLRVRG